MPHWYVEYDDAIALYQQGSALPQRIFIQGDDQNTATRCLPDALTGSIQMIHVPSEDRGPLQCYDVRYVQRGSGQRTGDNEKPDPQDCRGGSHSFIIETIQDESRWQEVPGDELRCTCGRVVVAVFRGELSMCMTEKGPPNA